MLGIPLLVLGFLVFGLLVTADAVYNVSICDLLGVSPSVLLDCELWGWAHKLGVFDY